MLGMMLVMFCSSEAQTSRPATLLMFCSSGEATRATRLAKPRLQRVCVCVCCGPLAKPRLAKFPFPLSLFCSSRRRARRGEVLEILHTNKDSSRKLIRHLFADPALAVSGPHLILFVSATRPLCLVLFEKQGGLI